MAENSFHQSLFITNNHISLYRNICKAQTERARLKVRRAQFALCSCYRLGFWLKRYARCKAFVLPAVRLKKHSLPPVRASGATSSSQPVRQFLYKPLTKSQHLCYNSVCGEMIHPQGQTSKPKQEQRSQQEKDRARE